jgi:hypothetical protein
VPYIQKSRQANVSVNHAGLVHAIAAELKNPEPVTLAKEVLGLRYEKPYIIEGTFRHSDRLEVWVVWTRWAGVREEHRTAAILDAYEEAFGQGKSKQVVVAIGVTPEEAKNLGIIQDGGGED